MRVGTKSLIFGVHQFAWHPITVLSAWWKLYGRPSFMELVCIIIHDWGYWGSPNMDGIEGERHPEGAALFASCLFGKEAHDLVLYHSRHYAKNAGVEPSKLCWADKLSIIYEPWWLYLPRAWASGELAEYRKMAKDYISPDRPHREWFAWVKDRLKTLGIAQRGDAVTYVNPERKTEAGA